MYIKFFVGSSLQDLESQVNAFAKTHIVKEIKPVSENTILVVYDTKSKHLYE